MVSRAQRYARQQVIATKAAFACAFGGKYTNEQQWEQEAKRRGFKVIEVTHPSGAGTWKVAKDRDGNRVGTFDPDRNQGELTQDPRFRPFNASASTTKVASDSFACATSLRPLAFSFPDELDRELFAAEVEFAFRKSPRRLETWAASCSVPVKSRDEAVVVNKIARKYQAVRASWACADMPMQTQPQQPAAPQQDPCDISLTFKTPQAAQMFAASAMRTQGAKVSLDDKSVKVTCSFESAPQLLTSAAKSMSGSGVVSAAAGPLIQKEVTAKFKDEQAASAFFKAVAAAGFPNVYKDDKWTVTVKTTPLKVQKVESLAQSEGGRIINS